MSTISPEELWSAFQRIDTPPPTKPSGKPIQYPTKYAGNRLLPSPESYSSNPGTGRWRCISWSFHQGFLCQPNILSPSFSPAYFAEMGSQWAQNLRTIAVDTPEFWVALIRWCEFRPHQPLWRLFKFRFLSIYAVILLSTLTGQHDLREEEDGYSSTIASSEASIPDELSLFDLSSNQPLLTSNVKDLFVLRAINKIFQSDVGPIFMSIFGLSLPISYDDWSRLTLPTHELSKLAVSFVSHYRSNWPRCELSTDRTLNIHWPHTPSEWSHVGPIIDEIQGTTRAVFESLISSQHKSMLDDLSQLTSDNDALAVEIVEKQNSLSSFQSQLDDITKQIADQQQSNESLQREYKRLKESSNRARESRNRYKRELERLRRDKEHAERVMEDDHRQAYHELGKIHAAIFTAQTKLQALESQNPYPHSHSNHYNRRDPANTSYHNSSYGQPRQPVTNQSSPARRSRSNNRNPQEPQNRRSYRSPTPNSSSPKSRNHTSNPQGRFSSNPSNRPFPRNRNSTAPRKPPISNDRTIFSDSNTSRGNTRDRFTPNSSHRIDPEPNQQSPRHNVSSPPNNDNRGWYDEKEYQPPAGKGYYDPRNEFPNPSPETN